VIVVVEPLVELTAVTVGVIVAEETAADDVVVVRAAGVELVDAIVYCCAATDEVVVTEYEANPVEATAAAASETVAEEE